MSIIKSIATQYAGLDPDKISRNSAFGIIYNNTVVGETQLIKHPKGMRVVALVLQELGFENPKQVVEGNLDDF